MEQTVFRWTVAANTSNKQSRTVGKGRSVTLEIERSNVTPLYNSGMRSWKSGLKSKTIFGGGCYTLRGSSRYESGQNKINLDTVIYLTFVTKFSFYFQIWHIYICKETTYIEPKQFITTSGHKKSRDVNRNDVYRKDLYNEW
jgi:hypothetical protein